VLADGGTVRAMKENGGLTISVFTSPAILTAGEVDISVLVQDAQSHAALSAADIHVTVTPREHIYLAERHEATTALATNRLMKACHVPLSAGWHDVEVLVTDNNHHGRVVFSMLVGPNRTRAAGFWPWFAWPAVPLTLVIANLAYRRLLIRRSAIMQHCAAQSPTPP
jgi:hypothetical protein